jgi:hypothetical protein
LVEVVIGRVVVFGDDFIQRCISAGLHFVDLVGFFADQSRASGEVNRSPLKQAAGAPSAGVSVR